MAGIYCICGMSVCLYICQGVHMLVFACEHVHIKRCSSVSALWWETTVLSAASCCWQAPTLCHEENSCFPSMPGYEPCPCGSPHLLHFSFSLCADTVHLTSTISILMTHKHSNVSLPSITFRFSLCACLLPSVTEDNMDLGLSCSLPKTETLRQLTSKQIEGYSGS